MVKDTGQNTNSAQAGTTIEANEFAFLLKQSFMPQTEHAAVEIEAGVSTLIREALKDTSKIKSDVRDTIEEMIVRIDRTLSAQINEILHAAEFRHVESAWRGLHYLVCNSETDADLKIRVLNISKVELYRNLRLYPGVRWEQNPLFTQICAYALGEPDSDPFGCLIGDYDFSHVPTDVQLLHDLSKIASAAHAPFFASAEPTLIGMESWTELANPRELSDVFDRPDYATWQGLRRQHEARYLGLCMPHALGRLPYGGNSEPVKEFDFEEKTDGYGDENHSWINAAYAMAVNINRAFRQFGWCARICGAQSGGEIINLPTHTFPSDDAGVNVKCPTEIAIGTPNAYKLAKFGLIPLVRPESTDGAAFNSIPSLYEPIQSADDSSTQLPCILAASRFVHYLKYIARDGIGSTEGPEQLTNALQTWIDAYVDADPTTSTEAQKARKPLAAAEVDIIADEDDPGRYQLRVFVRPHFQLEGMDAGVSLTARLPGPAL